MELDINELLPFSPLVKTFTFNAWVVAGFTPSHEAHSSITILIVRWE
jgi:hypothetical protein